MFAMSAEVIARLGDELFESFSVCICFI